MTQFRQPGDAWYTLLYRDAHRHWWAPALFMFVVFVVFAGFFRVAGEDWDTSLLFAGITSGLYWLFSGLRYRAHRNP